MTGNANDPFGGFPIVAPGGQFSLRLGNNGVGGQADRLEQTFLVSAANANFTYKYAVVFQDPGHTAAQQPAFIIEMFDSLNFQCNRNTTTTRAYNHRKPIGYFVEESFF